MPRRSRPILRFLALGAFAVPVAMLLPSMGADEAGAQPEDGAAQAAPPSPEEVERRRAEFRDALLEEYDTSDARVDLTALLAPGVARDGIPALTDPPAAPASGAAFPAPGARVVEVTINGETAGYPIGVLNWHEIVNDTLGAVPIAVLYCPLCDSVSVVERTLPGDGPEVVAEFGVSGLLHNSNVVMYDRQEMSLWSQVGAAALTGPRAGERLAHRPFRMTTMADLAARHPKARVVTSDTGHERPYDRNPYAEYFASDRVFHAFEYDDRVPAKELGVGVRIGDVALFVRRSALADDGSARRFATGAGDVVIGADGAGFRVLELPEGATAVQTFYHSWAAFHPGTGIVPAG